MSHILHINDNNLLVQQISEGRMVLLLRSQGYAWLKEDQVIFDLEDDNHPAKHCRIAPQEINNRYWQQCAQTAIAGNGAGMRHAADLIWKHLGALKSKLDINSLAMVVPANYRDSHLQLLLGVAKANDLVSPGLVSKPVLAAQQERFPIGTATHIDLQLHQTVVSTLTVSATEVTLSDVVIKTDLGIHALQESLLRNLQVAFIRSERFDPLHDATTEQQLFDQLPAIIASLANGDKVSVGVEHQGKLYSTSVDRNEVEDAFIEFNALLKENVGNVIIDTNAAFDLSGLQGLANQALVWATGAPSLNLESFGSDGADGTEEALLYQTSLPSLRKSTVDTVRPLPAKKSHTERVKKTEPLNDGATSVTHLMQKGVAIAINQVCVNVDNAILSINSHESVSDLDDMLKNGQLEIVNDAARSSVAELRANDRLVSPLADGVLTALRVD